MPDNIALDTESARRFIHSADAVASKLDEIGQRVQARQLPTLPSSFRGQIESMRHDASSVSLRTGRQVDASADEMHVRVAKFELADRLENGSMIVDLLLLPFDWWLNPKSFTRNGFVRAWNRDGAKGLRRYLQRAGAGRKGSIARTRPYLQRGSAADEALRTGGKALKYGSRALGVVGGVVTFGLTYDEYHSGGDSVTDAGTVATTTTAGAVGGAWAGATAGAAIGTLIPVPIVGTVAGGAIGGVIGGVAGSTGGEWVGNQLKKALVR